MSYNPLPTSQVETPPKSYSGKGERRPQTGRAARTNDPLRLPDGMHGMSPQGRRWRDLVGFYTAQLGERSRQEQVRALLGSLISMTLISERLNDRVTRGEDVDPNHLIQLSQSILRLLNELGLNGAPSKPDTEGPSLKDHIARRVGVK
ncbi:hypothetical protein IVB56_27235 [Bradyrhizobium sp. CW7]|uniref:hypothetical protein n=1 Tax=Bradyrhizobium sp. CW7 TaxID=2782688 RepID=UPI001FFB52B4|nr:hypothetical protein [Bradyrhizobium sp. CW7]MCK1354642.1 hypothetical protein [Bradyrhizobium sp. CW7]